MSFVFKVAALTTAAVALTAPNGLVLGIELHDLLAAYAGAFCGLAYNMPKGVGCVEETSLWKLTGHIIRMAAICVFFVNANAIASGWVVVLLCKYEYIAKGTGAPVGGLLAFAAQRWLPRLVDFISDGLSAIASKRLGK